MAAINKWYRINSIKKMPAFSDFSEYLSCETMPQAAISENIPMCLMPGCNAADIAYGFDGLRQLAEAGKKVFYRLHTEVEITNNPALAENVMFCFPAGKKGPFAVVVPGGGYEKVCSMFEGFPVVYELSHMGITACVVEYRHGKNAAYPAPQDDLATAVRYIFDHAKELNVDTDDYVVIGFSAGGHLSGSFCTESLGWKRYGLPKPAALFLGYPVATMSEYTHRQSRENLLRGRKDDAAERERFSLEKETDENTTPVFLWQCDRDNIVPFENSRLLDRRLTECGVEHKYEVFPGTAHCWGLATGKAAEGWLHRAVDFWREQAEKGAVK